MKRAELTKLGPSKEQIKGVQELHRRDMQYVDMNGPKTELIGGNNHERSIIRTRTLDR